MKRIVTVVTVVVTILHRLVIFVDRKIGRRKIVSCPPEQALKTRCAADDIGGDRWAPFEGAPKLVQSLGLEENRYITYGIVAGRPECRKNVCRKNANTDSRR